jgi:hypothetical protein
MSPPCVRGVACEPVVLSTELRRSYTTCESSLVLLLLASSEAEVLDGRRRRFVPAGAVPTLARLRYLKALGRNLPSRSRFDASSGNANPSPHAVCCGAREQVSCRAAAPRSRCTHTCGWVPCAPPCR